MSSALAQDCEQITGKTEVSRKKYFRLIFFFQIRLALPVSRLLDQPVKGPALGWRVIRE